MTSTTPSFLTKARQKTGSFLMERGFRTISFVGKSFPALRKIQKNIEVQTNIPYSNQDSPWNLLDIYRPKNAKGPLPTVFYVHGGGFRMLSKDTHWVMGFLFANEGFQVISINYRLAPDHPCPAAVEDTMEAYAWMIEHAEELNIDLDRLVVSGESAGGNLALSVVLACTTPIPDFALAQKLWALNVIPKAVIPACGLHQATDLARFGRRRPLPSWITDRMETIEKAYAPEPRPPGYDPADPLLYLESLTATERPLPPFFIPVGTRDPILDDSRRLHNALQTLKAPSELAVYEGEIHTFHAFVWREKAKTCWNDSFTFLRNLNLI